MMGSVNSIVSCKDLNNKNFIVQGALSNLKCKKKKPLKFKEWMQYDEFFQGAKNLVGKASSGMKNAFSLAKAAAGGQTIKAMPGENLDDKAREAEKLSKQTQGMVTLLFNNRKIVYMNGIFQPNLSKLK